MLHDLSITAAQAAYMGEWVAQEGADVLLALDHGVLLVGQGDDRFLINPDGSEDPGCYYCGRPAAAHGGDAPEPHEYVPTAEVPDPFEGGCWGVPVPTATDDDGVPLFSAETRAESERPAPDGESETGRRGTTPSSSASGKDRSPVDDSRAAALDDPRGERDR